MTTSGNSIPNGFCQTANPQYAMPTRRGSWICSHLCPASIYYDRPKGSTSQIRSAPRGVTENVSLFAVTKNCVFGTGSGGFASAPNLLYQLARFFAKDKKPLSGSGRGRFSRQLLSLFQTCSCRVNQSGEPKDLFHENQNFIHKKSDEPLAYAASILTHLARARLRVVCPCAASACNLPRCVLSEQQHRSR